MSQWSSMFYARLCWGWRQKSIRKSAEGGSDSREKQREWEENLSLSNPGSYWKKGKREICVCVRVSYLIFDTFLMTIDFSLEKVSRIFCRKTLFSTTEGTSTRYIPGIGVYRLWDHNNSRQWIFWKRMQTVKQLNHRKTRVHNGVHSGVLEKFEIDSKETILWQKFLKIFAELSFKYCVNTYSNNLDSTYVIVFRQEKKRNLSFMQNTDSTKTILIFKKVNKFSV